MQGPKILAPAVFLLGVLLCLEGGAALAADALPVHRQKLLRGHWSEQKDIMRNSHQALLKDRMNAEYPLTVPQQAVSIGQCVTCHVVRGADNAPLAADNGKHFCRDCHAKQKVSINCFSCHASLPASDPYVMSKEVKNADMLKQRLAQWQAGQGGKK
jgi:predicted CXXCH cytochrome family protein